MKWPILQEKMDHSLLAWWKKEVLKANEYEKKNFICEPEQVSILGEEEDIDENYVQSFMHYLGIHASMKR